MIYFILGVVVLACLLLLLFSLLRIASKCSRIEEGEE